MSRRAAATALAGTIGLALAGCAHDRSDGAPDPEERWMRSFRRGQVAYENHRLDQAEQHFSVARRFARTLASDDARRLDTERAYAVTLWSLGHLTRAEAVLLALLETQEGIEGLPEPELATTLYSLGVVYTRQERFAEAIPPLRRALEIQSRTVGPSAAVADTLNLLGDLDRQRGYLEASEAYYRSALLICEQARPVPSESVAELRNSWALLERQKGSTIEAERLHKIAIRLAGQVKGEHSPAVSRYQRDLAALYLLQGRTDDAIAYASRAVDGFEDLYGSDHPEYRRSLLLYADALEAARRFHEAGAAREHALTVRTAH